MPQIVNTHVAIITLRVKSQIIKHTAIDQGFFIFLVLGVWFFFFFAFFFCRLNLVQLKQCKLDSVVCRFLGAFQDRLFSICPSLGVGESSISSRIELYVEA